MPSSKKQKCTRSSAEPVEQDPILAAMREAVTRPERRDEFMQVFEELIRKHCIEAQGHVAPDVEAELAGIREALAEMREREKEEAKALEIAKKKWQDALSDCRAKGEITRKKNAEVKRDLLMLETEVENLKTKSRYLKESNATLKANNAKMRAEVSNLTEVVDVLGKANIACAEGLRAVASDPRWAYVF